MKKIMKVVSLILTFALMVGMAIPSMTAFAAYPDGQQTAGGKSTITLLPQSTSADASFANKSFSAYRILTITSDESSGDAYALPYTEDPNGTDSGVEPDDLNDDSTPSFNYKIRQNLIDAINAGHPESDPIEKEKRLKSTADLQEILRHLRDHEQGDGHGSTETGEYLEENTTIEAFAKKMLEYIEANDDVGGPYYDLKLSAGTPAKDSYTFTDAPFGYYLIKDDGAKSGYEMTTALIMLNADDGTKGEKIYVKGTIPTLDKTVTGDKKGNGVAVGDKVTFTLKTTLPSAVGFKNFTYTITDKLSEGLTLSDEDGNAIDSGDFSVSNLTITIGGKELLIPAGLVTATDKAGTNGDAGKTILTIDLAPLAVAVAKNETGKFDEGVIDGNTIPQVGQEIEITYNAVLNNKAALGAEKPNTNDAVLKYSNNPNEETVGQGTDTPPSETKTYTFGIKIIKEDSQEYKPIRGAKFVIKNSEGKFALATNSAGEDVQGETASTGAPQTYVFKEWVTDQSDATVFVTTADGVVGSSDAATVQLNGLAAGTYHICETTPSVIYNGKTYYRIDDDIQFTIAATYNNEDSGNGKLNSLTYKLDSAYNGVKGSAELTNGHQFSNDVSALANGYADITILNSQREPLPETGGMGTTLLYVVGGALIVIAGVLLISKRRMHAAR